MSVPPEDLYGQWLALRASEKRLFALDVAKRLEVTECELVASACGVDGSPSAVRLSIADWPDFMSNLPKLGFVKTVTRNLPAVIEVEGNYEHVEFFGAHGQSLGSIDLRIFLRSWKHAFFIKDQTSRGVSESLQFFDETGRAIHKLYLREESNRSLFFELIEKHRAEEQSRAQSVEPETASKPARPDGEVDVEALRKAWLAMTDTHEFFGLLHRFGLTRTQAFRLVGRDLAYPLADARGSLEQILEHAAKTELSIMVFVGNGGIIQIYSGKIGKVAPMGPWINVLDPTFNLHVQRDFVDSAWVVRKPTKDGNVTSLELYTPEGEQIALLVGLRKPGQVENAAWRTAVEALPEGQSAT